MSRVQRRKRGVFGRIARGYLMVAGAAFTLYWLVRGVAWLDVWLAGRTLG